MQCKRIGQARTGATIHRGLTAIALFACGLVGLSAHASGASFGMAQVVKKAKDLASKPYQAPPKTPQSYAKLNFDQWNAIRFKRDKALWQGREFHVQFYPAGYIYPHKIKMNVVDENGVHRVKSSPSLFDYDKKTTGTQIKSDIGFAGFRLLYPLNKSDKYDEVASFLGASYFRAVAKGNIYGLSSRGLAVDTGSSQGEKFPLFREFWLKKPLKNAGKVTIYALLDSPEIAGAYRFTVKPGKQTVMGVKAVLFPRKKIDKLGIAPLTSMYYYGVGNHKPKDKAFQAAHDSGGLLIHTARGKWLWRPLKNPQGVLDNTFSVEHIKGFGLMQRDRNPKHYAGTGQGYARRPSAWITPESGWPKGRVELVSFHTTNQTNDNVVAFWNPDEPIKPGKELQLSYKIHWQGAKPVRSTLGRVTATRIGTSEKGWKKFVVDFTGGPLKAMPADADLDIHVNAGGAKILDKRILHNGETGGWRLVMKIKPQGEQENPVSATLIQDGKPVTETWNYPVGSNK
jgi:glucans biosynthesis protein